MELSRLLPLAFPLCLEGLSTFFDFAQDFVFEGELVRDTGVFF
jgi:hypothetical protein